MKVWLYRRRLSMASGAGQLVNMQAEGLQRAGIEPVLAAQRGRLEYFLRSGRYVKHASLRKARKLAASHRDIFVDHSARVPEADLVFVHNLSSAAARHVPGGGFGDELPEERRFFESLSPSARIVANSEMVKNAIAADYQVDPERIDVLYPGFDAARYTPDRLADLRSEGRAALGIEADVPLIGFVTSGSFRKRGIDIFIDTAARIRERNRDVRFLIVGSARLPGSVGWHALVRDKIIAYRPKSVWPERWFAALDVFFYPARWEEFGMVVAEARALGVPVLTSRRVGAAECLPASYASWLCDEPVTSEFVERALALIADSDLRAHLAESGRESIGLLDGKHYGAQSTELILAQARTAGSDRA